MLIHRECFFCGKRHIDYYNRQTCSLEELAKKTSFEVLILILKDMKKFLKNNCDDPTIMASTSCFCKFSIQLAFEEANGRLNSYTDLHEVAFVAIIKLIKHAASIEEISLFMSSAYEEDQLEGVVNLIKGKLFENLSVAHENADGDEWTAYLHEDEAYPGSDMIMTNSETGETIELSLKATENLNYIESSLLKYPEFPILTTSEIPEEYPDLEMVIASDFSHREIKEITESNFEELVDNLTPFSRLSGASAVSFGVAGATAFSLWPFVVAYKRNKISQEQLKKACEKVFPKAGEELVYRLTLMVVLGPIYGWYVIAKTAMKLTPRPKDPPPKDTSGKYLAWKKK